MLSIGAQCAAETLRKLADDIESGRRVFSSFSVEPVLNEAHWCSDDPAPEPTQIIYTLVEDK